MVPGEARAVDFHFSQSPTCNGGEPVSIVLSVFGIFDCARSPTCMGWRWRSRSVAWRDSPRNLNSQVPSSKSGTTTTRNNHPACDAYGIDIADGENDVLILASAVVIPTKNGSGCLLSCDLAALRSRARARVIAPGQ